MTTAAGKSWKFKCLEGRGLLETPPGRNPPKGDPNAGVYEIEPVLDSQRIRIKPKFPSTGKVVYSIGRQHYSSFRVGNDVPARLRWWPIYAVAQINNVFPNPAPDGRTRWVAYPKPHVVIQYFDGVSGDLLYAEPVHHT